MNRKKRPLEPIYSNVLELLCHNRKIPSECQNMKQKTNNVCLETKETIYSHLRTSRDH